MIDSGKSGYLKARNGILRLASLDIERYLLADHHLGQLRRICFGGVDRRNMLTLA